MKYLMQKKGRFLLVMMLISLIALCGCSKTSTEPEADTATDNESASKEAAFVMDDGTDVFEGDEEENEEPEYSLPKEGTSSSAIINGDNAYFIGAREITTLNLKSGESEVLWSEKGEASEDAYSYGKGILLYDKIYFYSQYYSDINMDYVCKLQVVNLDGSDYKLVADYTIEGYCTGDMYYRDGTLYVDGNGKDDCYLIDETGNITSNVDRSSVAEYYDANTEYVRFAYGAGCIRRSLASAFDYKKIVTSGDAEEMLYDMDTDRSVSLGGTVVAQSKDELLVREDQNDRYIYGTISLKSGEYKYLFTSDKNKTFIATDDKFAYNYETDSDGNAIFYKTNLENGKENEVYNFQLKESSVNSYLISSFEPTVIGNYLFTAESHDYAMYLQAVNLETGEAIVTKEAYFDTGISKVGKLTLKKEEVAADDGKVVSTAKTRVLEIDKKYAGADVINKIMQDQAEVMFDAQTDSKQDAIDFYKEMSADGDEFNLQYGFTIEPEAIAYFDGRILSFVLDGYFYYGGAHGSPTKYPYVFDIETGRQYKLAEVINVSDEEFNALVKAKYNELMDVDDTMFWEREEVMNYIDEYIASDYENFYFTEDGVSIFVYPYEIAAYAQGFPTITIPYEDLGIDLKNLPSDEPVEEETSSEAE